jgi:hypothetical protein
MADCTACFAVAALSGGAPISARIFRFCFSLLRTNDCKVPGCRPRAGFATWGAQWKQEEAVIQTMNEDKALHFDRLRQQLLKHQEPGLSRLHPIKKQNAFSIVFEHCGAVDAVPGGADAIRSFHPSLFIQDEAAHIPEGEESLNAVIPSQARIISISTAAPGWFELACSMDLPARVNPEEVMTKAEKAYPYPIDRQNC